MFIINTLILILFSWRRDLIRNRFLALYSDPFTVLQMVCVWTNEGGVRGAYPRDDIMRAAVHNRGRCQYVQHVSFCSLTLPCLRLWGATVPPPSAPLSAPPSYFTVAFKTSWVASHQHWPLHRGTNPLLCNPLSPHTLEWSIELPNMRGSGVWGEWEVSLVSL